MTAAMSFGSEIVNKYQNLAGKDVFSAIQKASATTGVDFGYLLEQAQAESNFDAKAKAKTSSATGLYQFIDSTWLETVAKHGYKHGLGHYGQEISYDPARGRLSVSSSQMRKEILELRKDPEIASKMAAEFAKDNRNYLERTTSSDIGSTEMYLAHFLGAGGASKFINGMDRNAGQKAANLFPEAARANKPVFYHKNGTPRSLEQVYAFFDRKFSGDAVVLPDMPAGGHPAPKVASGFYLAQDTRAEELFALQGQAAMRGLSATMRDAMMGGIDGIDGTGEKSARPAGGGFAARGGLFKTISEFDVMMMSDMVRQWTNEDKSRAHDLYRMAGRFA